jgi:iron complex transport system substrate-binding protein
VRVVTLLPAATEIVTALGGAGSLVGISHECDYPPSVQHLPRVTTTPIDVTAPGARIDADVRGLHDSGRTVIAIDADQLNALGPDLIISQGLCEVCAASEGEVHRLAASIRPSPRVLSLTAPNLEGIWSDIREVGAALDLADEAQELVLGLVSRLRRLQQSRPAPAPRVLCVEWLEPLYLAGHWVPELVSAAGGEDVGADPGGHSARHEWQELSPLRPDHIIVMLCGFGVDRARTELNNLADPDALDLMRRVPTWVIDANSYTSRPGPRVVDGARVIQSAVQARPASGVERWSPAAVFPRLQLNRPAM